MTKQKSVPPFIGVPATKHATSACFETGNQNLVYASWWARIHRTIAAFFSDKAKRLDVSPDEARKTPLSVSEQLKLFEELERTNVGTGNSRYGSYPQEPVRFRHIADHLVRGPREEVNDAGVRDLHGPDDQNDDHSR